MSEVIYNQEWLENLIKNKTEESIHLDFKASGSLMSTNDKKKEIGKDVSAFANSDGGIIVYGMNEVDHVAHSFSPINGNDATKEWLENVIINRIHRKIDNLRIHPVRLNGNIQQTVYIVEIPRSSLAPHMTDSRYYRRFEFQSVPMEEYEVRNLYSRRDMTKLSVERVEIEGTAGSYMAGVLTTYRITIRVFVKNIGSTIEELYKTEIWLPADFFIKFPTTNGNEIMTVDDYKVYSVPNRSPLFQNETMKTFLLTEDVDRNTYQKLQTQKMKVKLYYSSGMVEEEYDVTENLMEKNQKLTLEDFA